jgi:hypothetical protein
VFLPAPHAWESNAPFIAANPTRDFAGCRLIAPRQRGARAGQYFVRTFKALFVKEKNFASVIARPP